MQLLGVYLHPLKIIRVIISVAMFDVMANENGRCI